MTAPSQLFARIQEAVATHDVTAIVTYRGLWCPFCQDYLRRIAALAPEIIAAKGAIFAITAETPEQAATAKSEWNLSYEVLSDPTNEVVKKLNDTYGLGAFLTTEKDKRLANYPAGKGFVQPSLLFINRDGKVLFQWAITPGVNNYLGAMDRPVPAEVWALVQEAMKSNGSSVPSSAKVNTITSLDGITLPPAEEYAASVTQ